MPAMTQSSSVFSGVVARRLAGLAAAAVFFAAGPASALGLRLGARIGGGSGSIDDDLPGDPDVSAFAVGAAARLDLVLLAVEVDLLWRKNTWESSGVDTEIQRIAIPVIARLGFPLVPGLLTAEIGAGLEPRFLLSAEFGGTDISKNVNDQVLYLPLVAGLDLDLKVIGAGVEVRYERQLSNEGDNPDFKVHQLMFFGGVFF